MIFSDRSLHSAANHSVAIHLMKPSSLFFAFIISISSLGAAPDESKTWTDPEVARREDPDFSIQGEYRNETMGAQVVALGGGKFDLYLLEGGLPGAGWEPGNSRIQLKGEKSRFSDEASKTTATLENGLLSVTKADGAKQELKRIERRSQTLEALPPDNAIIISNGDEWENAKEEKGLLWANGSTTKQHFGSYTLHLEFRTPYKPVARGQHRGNSGVYHSGRWETQVLDSFGLTGEQNECGGLYSIAKPRLNMCLPPLTWQTYDVEFIAAKFDAAGTRTAWPRITVQLNGVLIHDNVELNKDFTTSAPLSTPLTSPEGPIHLQQHDNPVAFRNIWIERHS
jgi:hypothetical protein